MMKTFSFYMIYTLILYSCSLDVGNNPIELNQELSSSSEMASSFLYSEDVVSSSYEELLSSESNLASSAVESFSSNSKVVDANLITNGTFDNYSQEWWRILDWDIDSKVTVVDGEVKIVIGDGEVEIWDVLFGQSGISVLADSNYCLSIDARASVPFQMNISIKEKDGDHTNYSVSLAELSSEMQRYSFYINMGITDENAQIQLNLGGQGPVVLWLDNISLYKQHTEECE